MNMFKRLVVKKNERAMLYAEGDFQTILEPGLYRRFDPRNRLSVEVFSLNCPRFEHRLTGYLRKEQPALIERHFERFDTAEHEAGLRYEDGMLVEILPPGSRRLYWKGQNEQRLERIDLSQEYRLDAALVALLTQPGLRSQALQGLDAVLLTQVPAFQVGVLKVNGEVIELLPAGHYGFWRFNRQINVELVDIRIQVLEVSGQEILTRDKISLRLNLAANWHYSDVLLAHSRLAKPQEHLYRELQFGLRAAVGTRTLDELLENKQLIDEAVSSHLAAKLPGCGLEVSSLGVRDIILPGEMKTLLAQVVAAEKAAQANVIRRREETSATRSLLNTAKVMEDNPTALRLKELETLERVAERIDRISVFGGLDQVLNGLVSLAPK
ncbi:slipin family protein [Pseudomonas anguilliseptica]|uniref:SPFH domain / Band 7 family protein n=1 Tax=Pseudomonas anguilliseptica TaxID=53406 RepID=A0A1H4PG45_PSEAG|nr:slipin family protein [Pseudomonas anguilliseptica]SEC06311.1 SPFH domain / Band 7 family protein [Pseudomonas anguilliseptica]